LASVSNQVSTLIKYRGEIATRIISSARELDLECFAVYTENDALHTKGATQAIKLPSPASYLNVAELISVCQKHGIDAVHPGYGFLSESSEFSWKAWEAGITVIGPGWEILDRTGDKLKAKLLAEECGVPTLQALPTPTNDISEIKAFASKIGYPVMIKAVDGGGGRGIRLIRSADVLERAARRAIEESPSRQVFVEKAAVDGFLHVEIQIIGDGKGDVRHLWERQCSIQRKYQKVVEVAPCISKKRKFIAQVIESAVRMAQRVKYYSLGTFEFLANPTSEEFYFLEINPRLQVEHTITESLSSVDLVRAQLLLSQGASLSSAGLSEHVRDPTVPPPLYSCQLRITAENAHTEWSLSVGKISSFQFPTGNGIRIDTNLINGQPATIGSDFDSLIAKVIITAPSWDEVVRKAKRALADTKIEGVKTNIDILRGIVSHPDFSNGDCPTNWLETHQQSLLAAGEKVTSSLPQSTLFSLEATAASQAVRAAASGVVFSRGDAWSLTLSPKSDANSKTEEPTPHHLQITKLLRNEFPSFVSAEIAYTTPSGSQPYSLTLRSTTASGGAITSSHRKGDPANPSHVVNPFPGKLVEIAVDEGDWVKKDDVLCVVQQMKMELEVRSPRSGRVKYALEAEEGEEVNEGILVAEIESTPEGRLESKL